MPEHTMLNLMIISLLNILLWIIFLYSAVSVAYLFLLSFCGKFLYFRNLSVMPSLLKARRIAIMVPAYKEDGIIVSTAQNLLQLQYPKAFYEVFIIADSFQAETLATLRKLPVTVIEVSFEKSTKTKALNEAFARIGEAFDVALVCDADNMLARDFLQRINASFQLGIRAVQGQRVAKNLDSSYAILDACSEGINNHIFRRGANAIGLSSSIIGSGMAFEFRTLKEIMAGIKAVGGFDKVLQLALVERGISIQYLEEALIFDEKVSSSHAFEQQRRRWVSSQFIYLKQFFGKAMRRLLRGDLSYFNLAVANNLVLPRAFLLLLLPALTLVGFLMGAAWAFTALVLTAVYFLSLALALPPDLVNRNLLAAILRLPRAIGVMMGTVLQIRKSNKTFIHTVHTKTTITNPLFKEHAHEPLL